MFELAALLAGPLGGLLAGKAGADLSAIGPALGSALLGLRDLGLIHRILAHTHRDGKPLAGGGASVAHFNSAYQRNYGELLAAVWEVVKYNRFLSLPATMQPALRGILAKLATTASGAATSSEPPPSE